MNYFVLKFQLNGRKNCFVIVPPGTHSASNGIHKFTLPHERKADAQHGIPAMVADGHVTSFGFSDELYTFNQN